jgi:uncharacterized membrane protein
MMFGRGYFGNNGGNYGNYGGRGFDVLGRFGFIPIGLCILMAVVFIALIAVLVFVLVHNKHKSNTMNPANPLNSTNPMNQINPANQSAVELLKLQYVRGEISEEEFIRRKNLLNQ